MVLDLPPIISNNRAPCFQIREGNEAQACIYLQNNLAHHQKKEDELRRRTGTKNEHRIATKVGRVIRKEARRYRFTDSDNPNPQFRQIGGLKLCWFAFMNQFDNRKDTGAVLERIPLECPHQTLTPCSSSGELIAMMEGSIVNEEVLPLRDQLAQRAVR